MNLQSFPTSDGEYADIAINDQHFIVTEGTVPQSLIHSVRVLSTSGHDRAVNITLLDTKSSSTVSADRTGLFTRTIYVQGGATLPIEFTLVMRPHPEAPHLVNIFSDVVSVQLDDDQDSYSVFNAASATERNDEQKFSNFDLAIELESLRLLEDEAVAIRDQISHKKQAISQRMRQNRGKLCLKHLIQECDGVVCAARVIAQRICDKMGVLVDPAFGFTIAESNADHSAMQRSDRYQQFMNTQTSGSDSRVPTTEATHFADSPNPLLHVLQAIAGLLGLTVLWTLIKAKCASARSRVERAADLEERRNRRTYRRAARRAIMRKRWDDLMRAMNCFRPKEEVRMRDYDEKQALILQDAFLEQDKDFAGKSDIMEAEIRELRAAHEIVSSLVRVDDNRFEMITPVQHLPPAGPSTPIFVRSRASTNTLPSYTSETLPDYESRISHGRRLSGSTIGFTPSTSDDEGRRRDSDFSNSMLRVASRSDNSGSSVLDISARPSGETMRTARPFD